MTPLRQEYQSYLRLKNYSPKTIKQYTNSVSQYARYCGQCPGELGPKDIKRYLLYLIDERQCGWSKYRQTVSALRALYVKVLGHEWMAEHIPFPRRGRPLPKFLTSEEVAQVLTVIEHPKHHMMVATIYATGVRCGELVRLRVEDIDSRRNLIVVRNGKGQKERHTLLGKELLGKLRSYYREFRPKEWLFEGRNGHASTTVPQKACKRAEELSGIGREVTPNILRHSFAIALLERGEELLAISNLMGHSRIKTTEVYAHVTTKMLGNTPSPLDTLEYE